MFKKSGEVNNEGICWRYKPIYSLKQVLCGKYSQVKRFHNPTVQKCIKHSPNRPPLVKRHRPKNLGCSDYINWKCLKQIRII